MRRIKILLIVVLWTSIYHALSTQPNAKSYKVLTYSVEDGLSQGSVYSIFQDHLGFIWMSSYEGLNRFDGNSFTVFKEDHNPFTLKGSAISGIVQDSMMNIWVGSEKCLNKYDYGTGKFHHYYALQDGANINSQHFPFFTDDSIVLYANEIEGLVRLNYRSNQKTCLDSSLIYTRNYNLINSFATIDGMRIWVRNEHNLILFNTLEKSKKEVFPINDKSGENFVSCLDIDENGNAWVVKKGEVHIVDTKGDIVHSILIPSPITSDILDIKVNDPQTFWLGTSKNGLFLIDIEQGVLQQFESRGKNENSIISNLSSNMYKDKNGELWSSSDPNGVFHLVEDRLPFKKYTSFIHDGRLKELGGVKCLTQDQNRILLGTKFNHILSLDKFSGTIEKEKLSSHFENLEISAIHQAKDGRLWIGTYDGIFTRRNSLIEEISGYNKTYAKESGVIWSIVEDRYGHIYFSTDAGIYAYNPISDQISSLPFFKHQSSGVLFIDSRNFLYVPLHNSGFAYVNIDSLWLENEIDQQVEFFHFLKDTINIKCYVESEEDNSIWIGTTSGIIHSNISDSSFIVIKQYNHEDGLKSNYIYGLAYSDDDVWFSNNNGIGKIDTEEGKIRQYSLSDGLQGLEFNSNSYFKDSDGEIFFGGVNGFNVFNPENTYDEVELLNPPIIEKILFENHEDRIYRSGNIDLKIPNRNASFRINYVTPYYKRKEAIRYAYRINEGSWIDLKENNTLDFINLSPQDYRIDIKSYVYTMDERQGMTSLFLTITPYWYKSPWFFLSLTTLLLSLGYVFFRWRTRDIRIKENLRSRIAETQLTALQTQMNPHFIFNCLNTIDGYIASNESEEASRILSSFSKIIRKALNFSRKESVSLKEELDFINEYVRLEKSRTENAFDYSYNISHPEVLERIHIPPLSVQPFVENAIKHAFKGVSKQPSLSIEDTFDEEVYNLLIKDNGIGFDATEMNNNNSSLGLNITEERLKLYNQKHNKEFTVKIVSGYKSEGQNGTLVKLSFNTLNYNE